MSVSSSLLKEEEDEIGAKEGRRVNKADVEVGCEIFCRARGIRQYISARYEVRDLTLLSPFLRGW